MKRSTAQRQAVRPRWLPLLLLEGATFLSGAGNGVAIVAVPWLVLERTGSASVAGLVAAATALPVLAASLLSGTVVDLVGRRRTALVSDALSAASAVSIPLLDATVGLAVPVLVVLVLLGAVLDPAGVTARETMLPEAAGTAGWRLERANGVHEAVWGVAFLLGPGLGGLLILWLGAAGALTVTAAGFVGSVLLLARLRLPGAARPDERPQVRALWPATREGIRFVWHEPLLRPVGLLTVLLSAIYMPVEGVVLPVHFQEQAAPERFGLLILAMAGGGAAGALAYGVWGPWVQRRTAFVGCLVAAGVAFLLMAPLPAYPLLLAAAVAVGLAYGPVDPLVNLAMQTRTPEHLRGRVVGVLSATEYAAGPAGFLVVGPLVDWVGPRAVFVLLAVALLAVALASVRMRALRRFDEPVVRSGTCSSSASRDRAPDRGLIEA